MKHVLTAFIFLAAFGTFTTQSHAGPEIKSSRTAGFLYGFLSTMEDPMNAGDGVLVVSAEFGCAKHKANDQVYCMNEVGGITGEIAELIYDSFDAKSEESFDDVVVRTGTAGCASIEEPGKAPRFNCY